MKGVVESGIKVERGVAFSDIANLSDILQAYCHNILINTNELVYHEPYLFPDTVSTKSLQVKGSYGTFVSESSDYIKLYPNPAKEFITIEYQLPYAFKEGIVEILTINGFNMEVMKLHGSWGQKIIDLRTYKSGSYIIRLWADGKVLESEKFITH